MALRIAVFLVGARNCSVVEPHRLVPENQSMSVPVRITQKGKHEFRLPVSELGIDGNNNFCFLLFLLRMHPGARVQRAARALSWATIVYIIVFSIIMVIGYRPI